MDEDPIQLHSTLVECTKQIKALDEKIEELVKRRQEYYEKLSIIEKKIDISNSKLNEPKKEKFMEESFEWSEKANDLLRNVFKLEKFRSHQLPAINATLSNLDVLLIMPTGGGKSLCFQLPSLISKGMTLVISPLISLMEDQLKSLQQLGIPTAVLNSNTPKNLTSGITSSLSNKEGPPYKILYVTPERLSKSKLLMSHLQKCYNHGNFSRLVIDEAHCCSEWGHDFRPDYNKLGMMRLHFPNTPILSLTATATPSVIQDIQKILQVNSCLVFKDSFYRKNLTYSVIDVDDLKEDAYAKIANIVTKKYATMSGIIYCLTIKEVEELTVKLNKLNVCATKYHAQLTNEERSKAYHKWYNGEAQVIIATVAFGMGINKNNVRFVIHYNISKSFENYYQETGRAGRDGQKADCILLFRFADIFRASTFVANNGNGLANLYSMIRYVINRDECRKKQISEYFGDKWNHHCHERCDNCIKRTSACRVIDLKTEMHTIADIVNHTSSIDRNITFPKLIDLLTGKGEKGLKPSKPINWKHSRPITQHIVAQLLFDEFLKEKFHFTAYSIISYVNLGPRFNRSTEPIRFIIPKIEPLNSDSFLPPSKRIRTDDTTSSITVIDLE